MTKKEALEVILKMEQVERPGLLELISQKQYSLGSNSNRWISKLFPEKPKTNIKLCTYLLSKYDLKLCPKCENVKPIDEFSKNPTKAGNLNTNCKTCSKVYQDEYYPSYYAENKFRYAEARIRYYLRLKQATPVWADKNKIKEIYKNCPKGYHVDHIAPLQGESVCGLHIETNLQYLTAFDNCSKGNKFNTDL